MRKDKVRKRMKEHVVDEKGQSEREEGTYLRPGGSQLLKYVEGV